MRAGIVAVAGLLCANLACSQNQMGMGGGESGFVPIFDGKSLAGWQGHVEDYEAVDGILVCKQGAHGNLYTDAEYADFVLRFDYRLQAGGNNGIGIRAPIGDKAPASTGIEIQILDDDDPQYSNLKPVQYNGSVYGAVAARRGRMNPDGEWNTMEIRAEGPHIRVTLNGTLITDAHMDQIGPVTMHNMEFVGLHNRSGHIALCGHTHRVEFRNMRIKVLPAP